MASYRSKQPFPPKIIDNLDVVLVLLLLLLLILIIIIAFGSPGIPILGQPLKLSPGVTRPFRFSLQITAPGVSLCSLSFFFPVGSSSRNDV